MITYNVCGNCGGQDFHLSYGAPTVCGRCNRSIWVEVATETEKPSRAYINGALVNWGRRCESVDLVGDHIYGINESGSEEDARRGFLDYQNGLIEVSYL